MNKKLLSQSIKYALLIVFGISIFTTIAYADSLTTSHGLDQSQKSQNEQMPPFHGNPRFRKLWMIQSQFMPCRGNQRRPFCHNFSRNIKPKTTTPDTTSPVITLNGDVSMTLNVADTYAELGATATDNIDTKVNVIITGAVDTTTAGTYTIHYNATDVAGNQATEVLRTVTVNAVTPPLSTENPSPTT